MLQAVDLAIQYGTLLIALVGGAALAFGVWQLWRQRRHSQHLHTALNNMSQGLCMWSPTGHLIVCNERYIQMYDLTPRLAWPGSSLRELIEHRIKAGTFSGNPDQYIADLLASISKGKTVSN